MNIKRVLFGGYLTLYLEKEQTHHLENVISWFDVSDIHPLAVDVVSVGIPAAHGDALLSKVSALVPLFNTCSRTLQNEMVIKPSENDYYVLKATLLISQKVSCFCIPS